MSAIEIRTMHKADLPAVAELHRQSYPSDHFTSRFSKALLIDFYRELLKQNQYCLVAEEKLNVQGSAEIVGVIIAGERCDQAVQHFSKTHVLSLAITLLRNPEFLRDKIAGAIHMWRGAQGFQSRAKLVYLNVLVHPRVQGKGVAQLLNDFFETRAVVDGFSSYTLSVKKNNARAIGFYQKSGFVVEHETKNAFYFLKNLPLKKAAM